MPQLGLKHYWPLRLQQRTSREIGAARDRLAPSPHRYLFHAQPLGDLVAASVDHLSSKLDCHGTLVPQVACKPTPFAHPNLKAQHAPDHPLLYMFGAHSVEDNAFD